MTIVEAYQAGLGDGAVYAVAVMADNECERRRWLKEIQQKKREMREGEA